MPVAVVTGASAGIGAATARVLRDQGFDLVLGARREDRLRAVAEPLGARWKLLDVTDPASVEAFVAEVGEASVLVNNAGLSRGLDPIATTPEWHWREMIETNVMGLFRMTKAMLPVLERAPHAHIVNVGSIAGFQVYVGGGGYCASKHAVRAITQTLRLELVGKPIRITEVNAGLVETDFSLVRFEGDAEKAARPYAGIDPLVADDIADAIGWAVSRKPHVNIDEIVLKPVRQASVSVVARRA
jgi:NADP-dependent 3-hydroxy acid dehydrogenase YdfG